MINPIVNAPQMHGTQLTYPLAEHQPDPHAQVAPVPKSGEVSQDQVTLKNSAQPDPDR